MAAFVCLRVSTAQHEGEHQCSGVLASVHAQSRGSLQEVRGIAAARRAVTERWQRDTAMQARLAASGRHA